jgi:hypothetical protein
MAFRKQGRPVRPCDRRLGRCADARHDRAVPVPAAGPGDDSDSRQRFVELVREQSEPLPLEHTDAQAIRATSSYAPPLPSSASSCARQSAKPGLPASSDWAHQTSPSDLAKLPSIVTGSLCRPRPTTADRRRIGSRLTVATRAGTAHKTDAGLAPTVRANRISPPAGGASRRPPSPSPEPLTRSSAFSWMSEGATTIYCADPEPAKFGSRCRLAAPLRRAMRGSEGRRSPDPSASRESCAHGEKRSRVRG